MLPDFHDLADADVHLTDVRHDRLDDLGGLLLLLLGLLLLSRFLLLSWLLILGLFILLVSRCISLTLLRLLVLTLLVFWLLILGFFNLARRILLLFLCVLDRL